MDFQNNNRPHKPSKFITVNNNEQISRYSLIEWVNETCNSHYENVEELFDAVAYCKMLHDLDPNCISMKRVRLEPKFQHDYLNNWKAVQAAFMYLNVPNPVPAERLLAKGFQINFEFLRWFRKFYIDEKNNIEARRKAMEKEKTRGRSVANDTGASSSRSSRSRGGGAKQKKQTHQSAQPHLPQQQQQGQQPPAGASGACGGSTDTAGTGDLLTEYNMACSRLVSIEKFMTQLRDQPNQSDTIREICTTVLDMMHPIFCVSDAETTMHSEDGAREHQAAAERPSRE